MHFEMLIDGDADADDDDDDDVDDDSIHSFVHTYLFYVPEAPFEGRNISIIIC